MPPEPEWLRGLGFLDDEADVRDAGFQLRDVVQAATVPKSLDYTKYVDFVRDQKRTSSCVGWAVTRAMHVRAQIQGHRAAKHGSAQFAYTIGRANAFETKHPLKDDGSQPRNVIRAVRDWGLVDEATWPFDPELINELPSWEALEAGSNALDYGVAKFSWIQESGEAKFEEMKKALAAGFPLAFSVDVEEKFMKWDREDAIGVLEDGEKMFGSHYIAAIGYRDDAILIVNSWGNWADFGFAWISKERIAQDSTRAIVAIETAMTVT